MMKRMLFAAAALAMSVPAWSAGGTLDIRIADGWYDYDDDVNDIESDDPFGLDVRARFDFTPHIFVRGEYLNSDADELDFNGNELKSVDIEATVTRGGVGLQSDTTVRFYGVLEYIEVKLDIEDETAKDEGVMLSGGIQDSGKGHFLWNVELGLMRLDDSLGAVIDTTLGYRFNQTFALFGGLQSYSLEDDNRRGNDVELSIGHITVGGSISF